jgi:uncharacterized protein (DUF4415 family)
MPLTSIASKKTARPATIMPTVEEDATITAAALSDPDAQPLTDAQLGAMVPMKTLRGWQARMDGVLREYVARQAQPTP